MAHTPKCCGTCAKQKVTKTGSLRCTARLFEDPIWAEVNRKGFAVLNPKGEPANSPKQNDMHFTDGTDCRAYMVRT